MYPIFEPYDSGHLPVSEIHQIYYEQVGNPMGAPVLFVHGGPGGGIYPSARSFFDPLYYRTILFDQRGAGKSLPYACVEENTTQDLINDMEELRKELGIEKWILFGGSWGSTLALAYAIAHPNRVMALVLRGIFLARQSEIDWLYGANGAARLFPQEYERFSNFIGETEPQKVISAYYQKMTTGDEHSQLVAAREWDIWESSISQLIPHPPAEDEYANLESSLAIGRIEAHYFAHNSFFPDDEYLLREAKKLPKMPVTIVNGRYDVICPSHTALELHKAIPQSKLIVIPDAGHSSGEKGTANALLEAMNQLRSIL